MLVPIILVAGLALFAAYFVVNQKDGKQEREGLVREVLNKGAFFIEFDDNRTSVVKLFGVSMASEKEMLDEQIFEFLYAQVRGRRVRIKPVRVETGDVLVAEVYSLAGEYLNAILVRQGFGRWCPSQAANDKRIADAQQVARLNKQGVWNPAVQQLMAGGESKDAESSDVEAAAKVEPESSDIGERDSKHVSNEEAAATNASAQASASNDDFKPGLA